MAGLEFKSNARQVISFINARPARVSTVATQEMERLGHVWVREMVLDRFTGYRSSRNTGSKLQNRTGNLRDSVRSRVYGGGLGMGSTVLKLRVGDASAGYARLQETGLPKPIRPRKKKFLRVPLPAALQPGTGVPRADAMIVRSGKGYMTANGKPTFIHRSGSKLTIMRRDSKTQATPLHALVKSVRVPARLGAKRTLTKVLTREAPRVAKRIVASLGGR